MNGHDRSGQPKRSNEWLTDAAIEAVFQRRAGRADSSDLRERVFAATVVRRQRSGRWATIRSGLRMGAMDDHTVRRTLALVVALVALAALLVLTALVAHRLNELRPGERLAFIRDGDVYVANSDGSGAQRFLHDDGTRFSDLAWSPDGSRLALDSSGGAVLVDLSTGSVDHIGGTSPAWSPDGTRVAVLDQTVAVEAPEDVRIVDARTGSASHVYRIAGVGPMAWSPNGRWIAMTGVALTDAVVTAAQTGYPPEALIRLDADTGTVLQLDDPSEADRTRDPSWSPDSARIAFIRYSGCEGPGDPCATDVVLADADGSNSVQLAAGSGSFDQPTWSPDGRWMAIRGRQSISLARPQVIDGLTVMHPDGSQRQQLTAADVARYEWNPTSDGLRFRVDAAPGQTSRLWEVSLSGAVKALVISTDASSGTGLGFDWRTSSVAGQRPLLPSGASVTPEPTQAIRTPPPASAVDPSADWPFLGAATSCAAVTVDTKTGAIRHRATLCDPTTDDATGAWAPDGSAFAAVTADRGLTLARPDGTVTRSVAGLRDLSGVGWSPDGKWLTASGNDGSYLLRPDGTLVRALPDGASWSSDSRHLVVSMDDGTLLVGDSDGSDLRSIGSFPWLQTWAPDGSRFAFARDGDIWTAAADGTDLRNLTAFRLGGANRVDWSPDGRWVGVAPGRGLWLMHPDGTERRFIDLGPDVVAADLSWSPNGRQLAVDATDGTGTPTDVLLITVDGSAPTVIASASGALWSPDGRFLIVEDTSGIPGQYDVMNSDGTGRRPVTRDPLVSQLFDLIWIR